jgi:hypothetical protein
MENMNEGGYQKQAYDVDNSSSMGLRQPRPMYLQCTLELVVLNSSLYFYKLLRGGYLVYTPVLRFPRVAGERRNKEPVSFDLMTALFCFASCVMYSLIRRKQHACRR